jgi:hypothetical protein
MFHAQRLHGNGAPDQPRHGRASSAPLGLHLLLAICHLAISPYPPRMRRLLPAALIPTLMLGGCITPANDRITLGRDVRIESLAPAPARPAGPELAAPVGTPITQDPSLLGLDRANWQPTTIQVPVDGIAHRPIYAKRLHIASRTARQRGEYPNGESALQLTGGSIWQQQAEALANPLVAASDLLLFIPRLVLVPPWRVQSSPDVAYERSWQPDRPIFPEPVEPLLDDPFAAPPPHPVTP